MKLNSKYFDSIRVKPVVEADPSPDVPPCQWKGCAGAGLHRAPKGRGHDGEYYWFCMDHVRQYNASYNYFDGMSDAEVVDFQKDALTGHRPTWKVGVNSSEGPDQQRRHASQKGAFSDPHAFFAWRGRKSAETREPPRRLKPLQAKSFDALNLEHTATPAEVKARFKELVKRHHPDANGGDRRFEDKLREIIQAYNYLKQAGLA
jgi:hypothetical protein